MRFRTRSDYPPVTFTPHGSDTVPDYARKKQEDGTFLLEEVGEIDIYARIQAASDGTDVYSLLDAYSRTGNPEIINQQVSRYGDITRVPATLAELEQFRIDSKAAFDSLPARVRDAFGQSYEAFIRNPEQAAAVLESLSQQASGIIKKAHNHGSGSAFNAGVGSTSPDSPKAGGDT